MSEVTPIVVRYRHPLKSAEHLRYAVEAAISTANPQPGQQLPVAEVLADTLGIARNTPFNAYKLLRAVKLVSSQGGRAGTAIVGHWPMRTDITIMAQELIDLAIEDHVELPYLQALLSQLWPEPTTAERQEAREGRPVDADPPATRVETSPTMPWSDDDEDEFF